jgi:hypothetical protein
MDRDRLTAVDDVVDRRPFLHRDDGADRPGEDPAANGSGRFEYTLLSAAGLAAGIGLAVWLKNEADERYEAYLNTADPDVARDHFRAAERLDRWSLAGWVVAQASFVLLFLSVIRIAEPERIPTGGQAYVTPQPGGVLLGFEVAP